MAQALKCDERDAKLGLDRTRQIASLGDAPLPIVLTVQHDEGSFANVAAQLVARLPKGFVLLAPTSRFCTCVASLITRRVTLIENHFHMPIEKLRAFASDLKE